MAAKEAYAEALTGTQSAEVLEGIARACWWLGESRTALQHAERAFAGYQAEQQYDRAALLGIHICIWYLTNFDNVASARGWLSRAEHMAEECSDPAVAGWTELVSSYLADNAEETQRRLERAASTAKLASDQDLATMALADLGMSHVMTGDVERGIAMLDEAMASTLAGPRRMLEVVVWSSCNMLAACSLLDDLKRATEWCRAADRFMETYGCPFLQARCRSHYGRILVATGHWHQAEQELNRAVSMAADTGRGPRTEALTALAELRLRQGEPEIALELLEEADPTPWGVVTQAACFMALDLPDEARTVLHGELAVHAEHDPAYRALVAALVEAELAIGNEEEAARLVGSGAPAWQAPSYPRGAGLLARAAGQVGLARGDLAAARGQLSFALNVFVRLELPFEAALTELDLARVLAIEDHEAAVAKTKHALKALRGLGAPREADEAAAFLRALGVTPPPGPRTTGVLSARESEVLALIEQGLSNPEIARRLYVSPRTVGHHVSSILRKLGLRSRGEAAAFAARVTNR
jgi:DNA-binding CsgD family transcriptional regulator